MFRVLVTAMAVPTAWKKERYGPKTKVVCFEAEITKQRPLPGETVLCSCPGKGGPYSSGNKHDRRVAPREK
jgi:hypothetical protein